MRGGIGGARLVKEKDDEEYWHGSIGVRLTMNEGATWDKV